MSTDQPPRVLEVKSRYTDEEFHANAVFIIGVAQRRGGVEIVGKDGTVRARISVPGPDEDDEPAPKKGEPTRKAAYMDPTKPQRYFKYMKIEGLPEDSEAAAAIVNGIVTLEQVVLMRTTGAEHAEGCTEPKMPKMDVLGISLRVDPTDGVSVRNLVQDDPDDGAVIKVLDPVFIDAMSRADRDKAAQKKADAERAAERKEGDS